MFVYICVHITGASRCDNCLAGKYKAAAGINAACDNCEAGKYKANAGVNLACDNCEAGKYSADSGMSPECQLCGRQVSTTNNWCASEE